MYDVSRRLLFMLCRVLFRLRFDGLEHVPRDGAVVLCCNHRSLWDPVLLGIPLTRQVHFMAKAELLRVPVLRALLRSYGIIPVSRGQLGLDTIKTALRLLRDGRVVALFPEGTRSRTGALGEGKKGAASMAMRSGAVVVPVAICGTYKWGASMRVTYGAPFEWQPEQTMAPGDALQKWTDALMERIGQMIVDD